MTITKTIKPDALLFRFDPDAAEPIVRGAAYYDRTVVTENGEVLSSVENPAQAVSIAAGVPGLELAAILGTLAAGQQATLDEQTAAIAGHTAELAAKDANIQALLAEIDALRNPPGSAAEPDPEAPAI